MEIKKGRRRPARLGQCLGGPPQACDFLLSDTDNSENENKKDHSQHDRHPKEDALNATASGKNTASVRAGQTAQPCALTLQYDAKDQTY
jgi:hypothetical protein